MNTSSRWQEIIIIWQDNRWLYVIAGLFVGMLAAPAIQQITNDLNNLIGNLVPEAIGIIFTVLILDRLAENRSRENLKQQLLNELKSPAAGQATAALAWLKRENWLEADTLIGADLHRVNWDSAYVGDLNLERANLNGANLRNISTQFMETDGTRSEHPINLSNASLRYAHLEEATLVEADLSYAVLEHAHLDNAVLIKANLIGSDLSHAVLTDIKWADAILPDGTQWTPETNISRFTNPVHPEFEKTRLQINAIRLEQGLKTF